MNNTKTRKITFIALFSALAAIFMYIEFPLPFMPPFLKIDPSAVVILIGALIFGVKSAITMIFIKDAVHLLQTQTAGVGELADFIMLSVLVLVFMAIYNKNKIIKAAIISTIIMAIVGVFANMWLLIPFYKNIMPIESIIAACAAINPNINSMFGYYLLGVLPFNLIKGGLVTFITIILLPKLPLITKTIKK